MCFDTLEKVEQIGTPILLCSHKGATTLNVFSCQSFWGEVKAGYSEDSSQEPKITFEEDPEGIRAHLTPFSLSMSPLVFWLPMDRRK